MYYLFISLDAKGAEGPAGREHAPAQLYWQCATQHNGQVPWAPGDQDSQVKDTMAKDSQVKDSQSKDSVAASKDSQLEEAV